MSAFRRSGWVVWENDSLSNILLEGYPQLSYIVDNSPKTTEWEVSLHRGFSCKNQGLTEAYPLFKLSLTFYPFLNLQIYLQNLLWGSTGLKEKILLHIPVRKIFVLRILRGTIWKLSVLKFMSQTVKTHISRIIIIQIAVYTLHLRVFLHPSRYTQPLWGTH
jgi:hypothetical protein